MKKRRKRDAVGNLLPGLNDEADKYKKCTGIFRFSKNDEALNQKWVKFVSRKEWKPSNNSVICSGHFESKYLIYYYLLVFNMHLICIYRYFIK